MVCQKRLMSLVTEAATLLVDVTRGRRPHFDKCLSQVIHVFYRIPRVIRTVTLLVALTLSGSGQLIHSRSRLGNQESPVRRSMFPSLRLDPTLP